jgi:hypothetical protein
MFIAIKDKSARLRRIPMSLCPQTCRSYGASSFIGRESYKHLAALRPGQELKNTQQHAITALREISSKTAWAINCSSEKPIALH